MNLLTHIMSYDKTKLNQENCNCEECVSVENVESDNQITEYLKLSEEEIEQIINERYSDKDEKTKTFIRKALRKHGDRYDYSNVIWINGDDRIEIICRIEGHSSFWQRRHHHLNGSGCPKCGGTKRLTLKEFVEQGNIVHGEGRYDYSEVVYKNNKTKVCIICHNHDKPFRFMQKPNDHLNGNGCPKCANKIRANSQRKLFDEFIKQSSDIHGEGRYDYSKVNYVDTRIKVCIICHNHDESYEFFQTPNDHLDGHGCPKCGGSKKLTTEEFIEKANIKQGIGTYDYSESEYMGTYIPIKIICLKHGAFWQKPYMHLQGEGCPICNESQGEKKIRIFLINNNIEFEREKKFKDCRDKNPLPFDFYLSRYNICIEFDGEQHFIPYDFNSKESDEKKLENLKRTQYHDQIKNDYCKSHNIILLRFNNIKTVEEELMKYFQEHGIIKEESLFELVS